MVIWSYLESSDKCCFGETKAVKPNDFVLWKLLEIVVYSIYFAEWYFHFYDYMHYAWGYMNGTNHSKNQSRLAYIIKYVRNKLLQMWLL